MSKRPEELSDHELLAELVKAQREAAWSRRLGLLAAGLAVAALAVTIPMIAIALGEVRTAAAEARQMLSQAATSLSAIDGLVMSIGVTSESVSSFTDAAEKIGDIDIESLNASILRLSEILTPLARLFGGG